MAPLYQLSPSMLSADFTKLGEQLSILENAGCDWLHIDVMDGHFVPPISFGCPVISSIRPASKLFFDVHIMAFEPIRYVAAMKEAGADLITVHQEACEDLPATLAAIREAGMQVGVSVKPGTPISALEEVFDMVDMVLLMTVEPGYGGQGVVDGSFEKIAALREHLDGTGRTELPIQIDGGVRLDNVEEYLRAGASIIVAGSSVFRGDIAENIQVLRAKIAEEEAKRR